MNNIRTTQYEIKLMRRQLLSLTLLFTLFATRVSAGQEMPAMWGELAPGPYEVGFRTIFTFDHSRPSVPYSDWDGRLYATEQKPGRQMQINLWYPATISGNQENLAFDHYLNLMARQTDFGPIDQARKRFADEQFIKKVNALGGNGTFTIEKLNVLKELATAAYENAEPVPGKFPLVVFPNGGSPAFQSIMSEFFASHGFVVAAGALKGRHTFSEDISARGIETAVDDLGFLVNEALKFASADTEQICLIGNAIASSHIVAYQARNSKVDCLVSLEGGLLSQFEQTLLRQTPFYDAQEVNKPILAIYAPHEAIDPQHIAHLKFARRFLFHFPQMSEFHFLNFGEFEQFVPGIVGEPNGDVQAGFELAAVYSLKFFEAFLKGNKESEAFLTGQIPPDFSGHVENAEILEALPSPPSTPEIKNGFLDQGFEFIQETYDVLKVRNPTPFSPSFYAELKDWLAWRKDPEFENRYQLYQLALDSYPDSPTVNYYLAYFALETGRTELARTLNVKALEMLESDTSENLSEERKAEMREYITSDLENLQ